MTPKLDQYLDQVCRGIAGPRALRQHVRQELREHLLDAAARYRESGLGDEAALDRALEDFGGPDQVRQELEATHGHRLLAVVLDKALQWKELTMKAKWLWTTAAHLTLALVITLEVLLLLAIVTFIVPKQIYMWHEGLLEAGEGQLSWTLDVLRNLIWATNEWMWWVIPIAGIWLLFEWRYRGENKAMVRLSVMGAAATALMCAVGIVTAALVLPLMVNMPSINHRPPEPVVMKLVQELDDALGKLREAQARQDWDQVERQTLDASHAMDRLSRMGATPAVLATRNQQAEIERRRADLKTARESLREAWHAANRKDAGKLDQALAAFRSAYGDAAAPATRPAP